MIQMLHSRKRSGVLDKTAMIPHKQETGMRLSDPLWELYPRRTHSLIGLRCRQQRKYT